jgi:thiol-disulfide isomerase/thioredoxin
MLEALATTLTGGRFAEVQPAYVKGQAVWEVVGGELRSAAPRQAQPLRWTFSHNVASKSRALGAGGCGDCHADPSPFFDALVLQDPFGPDGRPVSVPMWQALGFERAAVVKPQVYETPQQALARAKAAGQPVVLSFRSSSCIPCQEMDRILADLRPRYAGRAVFVDVSLDPERIDWSLIDRYAIRVKPTTFLLNARGGVVTEKLGVWTPEDLAAQLDKLLEDGQR